MQLILSGGQVNTISGDNGTINILGSLTKNGSQIFNDSENLNTYTLLTTTAVLTSSILTTTALLTSYLLGTTTLLTSNLQAQVDTKIHSINNLSGNNISINGININVVSSGNTVTISAGFGSGGVSDHESLSNLQGGSFTQHYHLTSAEHTDRIFKTEVAGVSGFLQSQVNVITGNYTFLTTTELLTSNLQISKANLSGGNTFVGTQIISGNSFFLGNQTITGNSFLIGNHSITGNSFFLGNQSITGNSFFLGNQSITGNSVLIGNQTINGSLSVTGALNFSTSQTITANAIATTKNISAYNLSYGNQYYFEDHMFNGNNVIEFGDSSILVLYDTLNYDTFGAARFNPSSANLSKTLACKSLLKFSSGTKFTVGYDLKMIIGNLESLDFHVGYMLADATSGGLLSDGLYWKLHDTRWYMVSSNASVSTTASFGGVYDGSYLSLAVDYDVSAASAKYYYNNTLAGTITSNLPSNNIYMWPVAKLVTFATDFCYIYVDTIKQRYTSNNSYKQVII